MILLLLVACGQQRKPSDVPDPDPDPESAAGHSAATSPPPAEHSGVPVLAEPLPNPCHTPGGRDPAEVPPTAIVGSLGISAGENLGAPRPYGLGAQFLGAVTWVDQSVRLDPYEGLDDCEVFAPHAQTRSGTTVAAGALTWSFAAQLLPAAWHEADPYEGESRGYDEVLVGNHGIGWDDAEGQLLGAAVTGSADVPAFDLPALARFPGGPIELQTDEWPAEQPRDAVTVRWTPSPTDDGPLFVRMSPLTPLSEVNTIDCWLQDDGEWTVPAEVWDQLSLPATVLVSAYRRDWCMWEIAPGTFVEGWASDMAGAQVQVVKR